MAQMKASTPKQGIGERLRRLAVRQEGVLFLIMLASALFLATRSDKFLTVDNLLQQGRFMTEVGLIAIPMTYIIITGGIDLSVGSILGLTAIVLGWTWQELGFPLELAIMTGILSGTVAGLVNGLFIVRVGVPPLIMTLATLAFYRGLAEGISQAKSARGYPEWFFELGQGEALGIPTQLWLLIASVILFAIVLARTRLGRALYAIGNNETGARFSGLRVNRTLLLIYAFSGLMSAIAGTIFVSRVSTTRSDMGTGIELDVIAAVVLGGTSIFGGTGSIAGTMIGVALIQLLKNGLALTGVTSDATIVVIGSVLIFAILVNNFIQSRRLES